MSTSNPQGARPRIFYGWWVVLATVIGQIHAYGAIIIFTFSLFIEGLSSEFGWSRAQISLALTIPAYAIIFVAPIVGQLIDRFGPRRVLITSTVFLGVLTASLYGLTGSLWHFYLIFFLIPILGAGTFPTSYSRVLVSWFDSKRGLALGIGLTGTGVGAAILPPITSNVVQIYGWREGFLFLGVLILLIGVPVISLLLKERPSDLGLLPDGEQRTDTGRASLEETWGLELKDCLRTRHFWVVAVFFFLTGLFFVGATAHLVPMLIERGVAPERAPYLTPFVGVALIIGRVISGYLMDRFFAPFVVLATMLGPAAAFLMLIVGVDGTTAAVAMFLFGLAFGAEMDVMAYFVSRYFGVKNYGQIHGYIFGIFYIGAGPGPLLMGLAYDAFQSYQPALIVFLAAALLCSALMLLMPRYRMPGLPASEPATA